MRDVSEGTTHPTHSFIRPGVSEKTASQRINHISEVPVRSDLSCWQLCVQSVFQKSDAMMHS